MVMRVRRTKANEQYFLAVVPGNCKVNLKAVKSCCGGDASFAVPEIAAELTGCVMGAVPLYPFIRT
jgi:Ala-tRNA(Pro) deacylase